MSIDTATESENLVEIASWIEPDDGQDPDDDGYYDWPAPPAYTKYAVTGNMRADVLRKLGRLPDDPCEITLVEGTIEGGYSEYTVEHDYTIEVVVDGELVFEAETYWHGSALPKFLEWVTTP